MDRREPPETEEGWFALHDFRSFDWGAWRAAPDRERDRALREGIQHLRACSDPAAGETAVFSVTGHKADVLVVHFRPSLGDLNTLERGFDLTAFADFADRTTSFVSVTEASGYNVDLAAALAGNDDAGLSRYIQSRLHPPIPDATYVSFYPMNKRRDPDSNWYDLPYAERSEHMASHGDIGREYAGKVRQIITSSIGLDDWEWGVTLFADDPTEIKQLLYEMRFDPSTSQFAEFGHFYIGQQIQPSDIRALLAGDPVPTDADGSPGTIARENQADPEPAAVPREPSHGQPQPQPQSQPRPPGDEVTDRSKAAGAPDHDDTDANPPSDAGSEGIRGTLEDIGVYAGRPHGEDVYAVVVYSQGNVDDLFENFRGLRANFDHYDTHVKTAVYNGASGLHAVASIWETESAADTAGGFLSELPGVVRQAGDDAAEDTWGTMGMFYTVEPDHRIDFIEKFETVGDALSEMDGHIQTDLLENHEDENDMFIASRWESREAAMEFFQSDTFAETVDWGREVLADRPRHVFLA